MSAATNVRLRIVATVISLLHLSRHSVAINIAKLREGSYFRPFLEPRRLPEKALNVVILVARMTGISCSHVLAIISGINERVQAFLP